jgi:hypothetical protein
MVPRAQIQGAKYSVKKGIREKPRTTKLSGDSLKKEGHLVYCFAI